MQMMAAQILKIYRHGNITMRNIYIVENWLNCNKLYSMHYQIHTLRDNTYGK